MPPKKTGQKEVASQGNDFTLFREAMEQLKKEEKEINLNDGVKFNSNLSKVNSSLESFSPCLHSNIIEERGVGICIDCGEEVEEKVSHEKEWRYYGQNDNKHSSDPTRAQLRKSDERNIYKDVETLGLSEKIVAKANKLYADVVKGKIYRGNFRRSIIFACVFHAFKISRNPQSHERLIEMFKLTRKTGLKGLKFVNLNAPKQSKIRTTYITPVDLVGDIMDSFSATEEQKKEVVGIYEQVKDKSLKLNRSRPMSYSAGIVFYWILLKKKNISLKEFSKKVVLSELTINRIAREVASILEGDEKKLK